jgi:hypothetical protein
MLAAISRQLPNLLMGWTRLVLRPLLALLFYLSSPNNLVMAAGPRYIASARIAQETLLPTVILLDDVAVFMDRSSVACAVIVTLMSCLLCRKLVTSRSLIITSQYLQHKRKCQISHPILDVRYEQYFTFFAWFRKFRKGIMLHVWYLNRGSYLPCPLAPLPMSESFP